MNRITMTDLKRMGTGAILDACPLEITVEGEPVFVIESLDSVIALSDLHPRVKIMLKNMEQKARAGMPKGQQVYMREPAHMRKD